MDHISVSLLYSHPAAINHDVPRKVGMSATSAAHGKYMESQECYENTASCRALAKVLVIVFLTLFLLCHLLSSAYFLKPSRHGNQSHNKTDKMHATKVTQNDTSKVNLSSGVFANLSLAYFFL